MPELPEVETIRRGLQNKIIGKKIADVEVDSYKIFQGRRRDIIGKKVVGLERRAKVLRICLEDDKNLLFHLKMTGQLIYRPQIRNTKYEIRDSFAGGHPTKDWVAELPNQFTRITFTFDDESKLFFNDMRMFGWCKVLSGREVKEIFEREYGPEPLDGVYPEQSRETQGKPTDFTVEYLTKMANRFPNRKVKQFITDQEIIAGIGNIYADEALFHARISPLRPVREIANGEWKRLRDGIIKSLELGIKWGGSSIDTYVNAEGEVGGAHLHTKVYRRAGQPCANGCGGVVERITLGGRGTHYCPNCQK